MTTETDFTYRAYPSGSWHSLAPASTFMNRPTIAPEVEEATRQLDFDFHDDEAVAELLCIRWNDQAQKLRRGLGWGIPAIPFFGFALVQATTMTDPGTSMSANVTLLAGTLVIAMLFMLPYNIWLFRVYFSQERKNMRAQCNGYRRIAKLARKDGADLKPFYPHVAASRFHAKYKPLTEEQKAKARGLPQARPKGKMTKSQEKAGASASGAAK